MEDNQSWLETVDGEPSAPVKKYDGRTRRPIWQIIVYFPLVLLYIPCRAYVDWCDNTL